MNKSKSDLKKWPTLLRDEPANEDRLESFEALAKSIADMIRTRNAGATVCVDGAWGTGKSTFVRILAKELKSVTGRPLLDEDAASTPNTSVREIFDPHVFVYDAWAHSGDPLRRAFLMSFLESLRTETDWLKTKDGLCRKVRKQLARIRRSWAPGPDKWESLKEQLAGRSKQIEKSSSFEISLWGRVALLGGFLWTIKGIALRKIQILHPFHWAASWLKYDAWTALILLTIIAALILRPRGLSSVLANKGNVSENVSSSEEPVPTSIEFAEFFKKIASAALSDETGQCVTTGRRLIIVLDNLDRLSKTERESAWAFLRSFIDNSSIASRPWYAQIWVMVPWAESSVSLSSSAGDADKAAESSVTPKPADGVNMDMGLSEKLFQIRIDLPPPTLFSWEKTLRDLLVTAFGGTHDRYLSIVRLFHFKYSNDAEITMRRIIKFVNDIAVLKYQRDDMPIDTLAAYVAAGGRNDVVASLQKGHEFYELNRIIFREGQSETREAGTSDQKALPALSAQFSMLYYGSSEPGMAVNRVLVPAWEKLIKARDVWGVVDLLRNRSSLNALRTLTETSISWSDPVMAPNLFRILSFVERISKTHRAHDRLQGLTNSDDWKAVLMGVREAMSSLHPWPNSDLRASYVAYLRLTSSIPGARADALHSLSRMSVTDEYKYYVFDQIISFLTIDSLQRELAEEKRLLTLPFKGIDYLQFCEKVIAVLVKQRGDTIESLYDLGFGQWRPLEGWESVVEQLSAWGVDWQAILAMPLTWRRANDDALSGALDSLLYIVCNLAEPDDEPPPSLNEHKAMFEYLLLRLGASKTFKVLGAANRRKLMLYALMNGSDDRPPSIRRTILFLMSLIGDDLPSFTVSSSESDEVTGNEQSDAEIHYSVILSTPEIGARYAEVLKGSTWLKTLAGNVMDTWVSDDLYWDGLKNEIRNRMLERFPDTPRTEEELLIEIVARGIEITH